MPDTTTLDAIARDKPISAKRAKALVEELERAHRIIAAARHVVDEAARIHDTQPWPVKYAAPYGALVTLIEALEAYDKERTDA